MMLSFWLLCFAISLCVVYYRWKRRKLYRLAAKIRGPPAFPLIGTAYLFISFEDIFQKALKILEKWRSPIKIWMFHKLAVCVTDPKQIQIVLTNCLEKEQRYDFFKGMFGDSLLIAKVSIWKNHRKIINSAFNQKILDSFMDIFVKQSEVLVEQLEKVVEGGYFDVEKYLAPCSLDIICETAMGVSVQAQTMPSKFFQTTKRCAQLAMERIIRIWLWPDFLFRLSERGRESAKELKYFHEYAGNIVMKKQQEFQNQKQQPVFDDKTKKPFLEHLLTLDDQLTAVELRDEVNLIIAAGFDSVAATTSFVLVCLGMHQEIQKNVVEELDEIFGKTDRSITLEDLPKLTYMERVIKETMRLYPALLAIGRSITKDTDIGDCILPEGSSALIGILGTHRNPEIWPDPNKFDPDRFLPEEVAKRHPYSFIPFSAGPRNCIGYKYAMMEMKVLLSTILISFKIDTNIRQEDIRLEFYNISKMTGGANISITKR